MPTDPATWRPTVADIATLLPQRTGDAAGAAQATFTADTVPTATQVTGTIYQVQTEVATRLGDVPVALATPTRTGGGPVETPAGRVTALGAAAYIEIEFYPDMQIGGRSSADRLFEAYRAGLDALARAAADLDDGGELGDDPIPSPAWAYPAAVETGVGTSLWESF